MPQTESLVIDHHRKMSNVQLIDWHLLMLPKQKDEVFALANKLEIEPRDHTLGTLINSFKRKQQDLIYRKNSPARVAAVVMGKNMRLGADAPIGAAFFKHPLYSNDVLRCVLKFDGAIPLTKRDSQEKVRDELQNAMFLTLHYDAETHDKISELVLEYMNLITKRDKVKKELSHTLFATEPFMPQKHDRVLDTICDYMKLR